MCRSMYTDATKAASSKSNLSRRRRRSLSPINITSSPENSAYSQSPRSKKHRRGHHGHYSTDRYDPLSSLFPNRTNLKVSEPKDERGELIVQFWKAREYDSKTVLASTPPDIDDAYQPCARKYTYLEDGTGHPISKSQLDQFRSYITDIFITLNNDHHEVITGKGFWKDLSKGLKDAFWKEVRIKFPFLCYCDDNWKGQKFVVDYYR
jgi:hypothetical protein